MKTTNAKKRTQGGYSFVEVVVAVSILAIGMLSQASLTVTHVGQNVLNKQNRIALEAVQNQIEELKSHTFTEVFNDYNETSLQHFAVPELDAAKADADGTVGRVIFPTATDISSGLTVLREDVTSAALGMPRDLDGDGAIDTNAKNTTYKFLPVIVEIRWNSKLGDRSIRVAALLQPRS